MRIAIVANRVPITDVLRRAIARRPEHRVIWTAATSDESLRLCVTSPPDLLLVDLCSTGIDGVETTRRLAATTAVAILIVADNVQHSAQRAFEAVGCGALDAVDIPALEDGLDGSASLLLAKIDTVSRLIRLKSPEPASSSWSKAAPVDRRWLVAIGASAGGPAALAVLLRGLPKDFPAAVVIVQHVDAQFAKGMAEWLDERSSLPVMVATEGQSLNAGTVMLAGTDDHLTLKTANRLGYTSQPDNASYRPSVDVFFKSVSARWQGSVVGVLLTGMGNDGAQGLKTLRNRGHHTIAQDQASCVVYGMPKAAALLHAAVDILPVSDIAGAVTDVVAGKGRNAQEVARKNWKRAE
jgi:two-component system response regulator WspF